MSNVIKRRSECDVVGQTGKGCDAMERRRDCEDVDRVRGMIVRL